MAVLSHPTIKKALSFCRVHTLLTLIALGGLIVLLGFASNRFSWVMLFGVIGAIGLAFIVLKNPWHGILLLAFFIPFERLGSYDIAGATVRPSQVTALLTLISFIMFYLGRKKFPVPRFPIIWPLAIFAVVGFIGLLNAPQLERSVMVLAFQLFTFSIAFLLPLAIVKKEQLKQLFPFFFVSMLLVTLFGLFQFAGDLIGLPPEITGLRELYTKDVLGFPRIQSTALEPLYFANYLLIPLGILFSMFFARDRSLHPLFTIGLIGLGVVNLLLTVARGGYIAFAVCILVLVIAYVTKLFTWRNIFYALTSLVIVGIVLSQVVSFDEAYTQFVGHVGNIFEGASYNERVEMFEKSIDAWREHPIVGIGSGSFGPYESHHPYMIPDHGWRIVNNEYLELLAENGVIGFGAMVSVFLIVVVRSIKALIKTKDLYLRTILLGLFAAFIGILVQYNTFSILYIVHIWFAIGLLIAIQNMILHPKKQ